MGVFALRTQIKKRNKDKGLARVFTHSTFFLSVFFFAISLIGYASFGNDAAYFDLIVLRPSLENRSDVAIKIAIAFLSLQSKHLQFNYSFGRSSGVHSLL